MEFSKVSLSPSVEPPKTTNFELLENTKESILDMKKSFVDKFGMLKGQRLYAQAERLTVKSETLRANLESAAFKSTVQESDLMPKIEESYDYLLPPRNVQAASVNMISNSIF